MSNNFRPWGWALPRWTVIVSPFSLVQMNGGFLDCANQVKCLSISKLRGKFFT